MTISRINKGHYKGVVSNVPFEVTQSYNWKGAPLNWIGEIKFNNESVFVYDDSYKFIKEAVSKKIKELKSL